MRFLKASAFMTIMLLNAMLLLSVFSLRAYPRISNPSGGDVVAPQTGDLNCDGMIDLSDCMALLTWLFIDDKAVPCAIAQTPGATLEDVNERLDGILEAILNQSNDPCKSAAKRFIDNGDGTLTDGCTGLMWQETRASYDIDLDGSPDNLFNFNQAEQVAGLSDVGGYKDWRLPTFEEMEEFVVFLAGLPYKFHQLPRPRIHYGSSNYDYWTSTETWNGNSAYSIQMDPDNFWLATTGKSNENFLWLVRGE